MFPSELDQAKVLCYTDKGDFGYVFYTSGEVFDKIAYYAICTYDGDGQYYLFACNANYEVISDTIWDSIEECKCVVKRQLEGITWNCLKEMVYGVACP